MRTARTTMIIALSVAAVALPTAAGACPDDTVDTVDTVEVTWLMPVPQGGWSAKPTESTATWPQTLATGEECGDSWFQVDIYDNTLGTKRDTVNGLLSRGVLKDASEDFSVVISWSFVPQEPCPTLEQEQESEVPNGGGAAATSPATSTTSMAGAAVPAAASPRFAG